MSLFHTCVTPGEIRQTQINSEICSQQHLPSHPPPPPPLPPLPLHSLSHQDFPQYFQPLSFSLSYSHSPPLPPLPLHSLSHQDFPQYFSLSVSRYLILILLLYLPYLCILSDTKTSLNIFSLSVSRYLILILLLYLPYLCILSDTKTSLNIFRLSVSRYLPSHSPSLPLHSL